MENAQKKSDYAERVKAINSILLEQQQPRRNDNLASNTNSSKTQRVFYI
jgi:hypothetical protein